jgi:hypothetical protein
MSALGAFFGLAIDAEAVAASGAFGRHSKSGEQFSAEERDRQRREGFDRYAAEISPVVEWSGHVAGHAGIGLTLPSPLLD